MKQSTLISRNPKYFDAGDFSTTIDDLIVVTEDMREDIDLALSYSINEDEWLVPINYYAIKNNDSFPITVKWKIGLREVIFLFGAGAEGNADIFGASNDRFHMTENLILSPYV
ncbi:hypothetical protein BDB01DRAFT_838408 [Pilobolus umbonatus]|nr:hypothetical protein BDB01DRAFT_838408 [Pilobolus umbonatus]